VACSAVSDALDLRGEIPRRDEIIPLRFQAPKGIGYWKSILLRVGTRLRLSVPCQREEETPWLEA
jgi:hypothetical protein